MRMQVGPTQPFSQKLHADKYRGENETFREAASRIASTLADDTPHFHAFRDMLFDMRFMPAGRIQSAMGSTKRVTPYNCFVSGTIEDSLVDGTGSIMNRFSEALLTLRMGGGIGYDFSTLRPKGALIRKLQSRSSGPISFMNVYDAGCKCIASAGHRRGAQMGILRVDHPDIEEFIRAKQNKDQLTGFNISIAVTDEFMRAVEAKGTFELRFGKENYRTVDAFALWEMIMRSTWDWAEPGVIFIDRINEMNNLRYCETIAATNPCAEQPLPPFGACLLGSFNLVKYVTLGDNGFYFDDKRFLEDVPHVVRAMDNVVDKAIYPLYEQEKEAKSKRRMGLGVTGVANALEACGKPYGSTAFVTEMERILELMANACYQASAMLAKSKGEFPLYDEDKYLAGKFIQRLSPVTRELIAQNGIRNSHLLSIAPTGTISLCADNVSSGIEPVFDYELVRTIIEFGNQEVKYEISDYGFREFQIKGRRTADVTVDEHLAVLEGAYRWVDSAVSKTCNVPSSTPWHDFQALYFRAWKAGCKGCTTYQVGGKRGAILESKPDCGLAPETEGLACKIDETGQRTCE